MMEMENTVRICIEASIKALRQSKEIFNFGILSINQCILRINVGEDRKRDRNNQSCKQLLPLPLLGLLAFAQSTLIKSLCPAPSPKAGLHLKQTRWTESPLASSTESTRQPSYWPSVFIPNCFVHVLNLRELDSNHQTKRKSVGEGGKTKHISKHFFPPK